MCGFVAIFGRADNVVDIDELTRATDSINHRGPDDHGYFTEGPLGLGFRRLSILDLSNLSHQPFEDSDGRFVIVFNGEIYNYIELREKLRATGHVFRSTGDTEVLLAAYKEWGSDCLSRLNGMWAFVIYDRRERTLFGARDRFGVKPLFYSDEGGRYIFASEIKAITATNHKDGKINWRIAADYLLDGRLTEPDETNETFFEGISEIEAGHAFSLRIDGQFRTWPFWELPTSRMGDQDSPVEEFSEIFHDSVRLRLRSDVPVGVCLSGGLDSTAIICHMADALGAGPHEPVRAFSYMDENFDETEQVLATVEQTGAELYRLAGSSNEFLDKFAEVMWFHDEPLHSLNTLVSYELYGMAAKAGVKVMLNGQGADETWAGYPSYFHNYWYGLCERGEFRTFNKEAAVFAEEHSGLRELKAKTYRTIFRNQLRRIKLYRSLAMKRARMAAASDPWFTPDLMQRYEKVTPDYDSLDLDSALARSVNKNPLPLYLRTEDRNSMAHSVETRLPFLDYRLVTLAFNSSPEWKLRGHLNKYTLRKAMKGVIPEVVRSRVDKMGFPVSARDWFAGPLYDMVREVIDSIDARQNGIYQVDEILKDLDRHRRGEADFSGKLLQVVQLQLLSRQPAGKC